MGDEPCTPCLPGGAGSQGCLRLRGVLGRLQPRQHKEFPFFWQKKKDEILKAWLKGCCIYIHIYIYIKSFFPSAQHCFGVAQRQQPVRAGGMPDFRREQGVGLKQGRERRIASGGLISGLRVNPDTSTPPQPSGLQFSVSIRKQNLFFLSLLSTEQCLWRRTPPWMREDGRRREPRLCQLPLEKPCRLPFVPSW